MRFCVWEFGGKIVRQLWERKERRVSELREGKGKTVALF